MQVAPVVPPIAPQVSPTQEAEALKGQAEYFQKALDEIRKRIEELEAEKGQ